MKDKSILIVEDNKAVREMIRNILQIEGYNIFTASNGAEGISLLKEIQEPSLILLDMMMPELNGWGFLDRVRNDPKSAAIPIVVISAYDEIAKSVKPQAFVPKPIQLKTLLDAIEKLAA